MDIVGKQRSHFTISEPAVAFFANSFPGPEMHLINGNGRIKSVAFSTSRHPGIVLPDITFKVPHSGGGVRPDFCGKAIGVGLVDRIPSVGGLYVVLVGVALTHAGNEGFPDACQTRLHWIRGDVPAIEIADDRNKLGIRGPDGKLDSALPITLRKVGSKSFIG